MKKNNILLIILIVVLIVGIGVVLYGLYGTQSTKLKSVNDTSKDVIKKIQKPIATIEMLDMGIITVELEPEIAPQSVANFITLSNSGFYDGLTFHRVIPDFMVQGGDKAGTGSGAFEYCIKGEFTANRVANSLKHKRGVISMARSDYSQYGAGFEQYSYNSAGSQFFIMTKDTKSLDGYYAPFGTVLEGMDIVDQIANVEVITKEVGAEGQDKPVSPPTIKSIKVETYGVDYREPEKLEPFDYYKWIYENYGIDYNQIMNQQDYTIE